MARAVPGCSEERVAVVAAMVRALKVTLSRAHAIELVSPVSSEEGRCVLGCSMGPVLFHHRRSPVAHQLGSDQVTILHTWADACGKCVAVHKAFPLCTTAVSYRGSTKLFGVNALNR
jgi:hypothetical protein